MFFYFVILKFTDDHFKNSLIMNRLNFLSKQLNLAHNDALEIQRKFYTLHGEIEDLIYNTFYVFQKFEKRTNKYLKDNDSLARGLYRIYLDLMKKRFSLVPTLTHQAFIKKLRFETHRFKKIFKVPNAITLFFQLLDEKTSRLRIE